jgi:hypothetical protein
MFSMEIPSQFVVRYASTCHVAQPAGKLIAVFNQLAEHRCKHAVLQGAYYVGAGIAPQKNRCPEDDKIGD